MGEKSEEKGLGEGQYIGLPCVVLVHTPQLAPFSETASQHLANGTLPRRLLLQLLPVYLIDRHRSPWKLVGSGSTGVGCSLPDQAGLVMYYILLRALRPTVVRHYMRHHDQTVSDGFRPPT